MKRKKAAKVIAALVCVAMIGGIAANRTDVIAALESSKDSGTRSVHVSDSSIENSTLVIGSHLIHINGMTDKLYELAQGSANEFNQSKIYYKSELADGKWFEITSASSIADITSSGTPVSKSVIEALDFTHLTNSQGVTTDLRTGNTVSAYNIEDPYDLRVMEELEPIKVQYQILQGIKDPSDSDKEYMTMITDFFATNISSSGNMQDVAINGLETYKGSVIARKMPATWVSAVDTVIEQTDAQRRVDSLTLLSEALDILLSKASNQELSEEQKKAQEEKNSDSDSESESSSSTDLIVNSDVVAAIGDAKKNVEDGIAEYSAKLLEEGTTTAGKMRYQYSKELENCGMAYNNIGCDIATEKLVDLDNILNGNVADLESELNLLQSELVGEAYKAYMAKLAEGAGSDYRQAVSEGAAQAVKAKYLTDQKTATNAARLEYQAMLEEQFKRMTSTATQSYLLQLLDAVPGIKATVPSDEAKSYQLETVEEYRAWLRKELADVVQNDADSSTLGKLQIEKEELEKARQAALDQNDLAEEKRLTAQMEAKQADINAETKKLVDILNSPNSSESDKASALAGLGGGNAASVLNELADSIASDIRELDGNGNSKNTSGDGSGNESGDTGNTGDGSEGGNTGNTGDGSEGGNTGNTGDGSGSEGGNTGDGSGSEGGNAGDGSGSGDGTGGSSGNGSGSEGGNAGDGSGSGDGTGGSSGNGSGSESGNTGNGSGSESGNTGDGSGNTGDGSGNTGDGSGSEGGNAGDGSGNTGDGSGSEGGNAGDGSGNTGDGSGNGSGSDGTDGDTTDGSTAGLPDDIANKLEAFMAVSELDPDAAKAALGEIKNAVDNSSGLDASTANALSAELSDAEQKLDQMSTDQLSTSDLTELIEDILGGSFEDSNDASQAATVAALDQYAMENRNSDAKALALSYVNKLADRGNPYVYKKYNQEKAEYVSLQSVGKVLGYRYIFDDAHYSVTLSKAGEYYLFTNRKQEYTLTGGNTDQLEKPAGFMQTIYISSADSEKLFGAKAGYLDSSDQYALLITPKLDSRIADIYEQLK